MEQPLTLYQSILADKTLTPEEIRDEYGKLRSFPAYENKRNFYGNPLLYHYMLDILCQTGNAKGLTIKGEAEDPERRAFWFAQMEKLQRTGTFSVRFFECLRMCQFAINFFKPTTAKFLYKKFNATRVLDPCAGWGGRLLGAMALDGAVSYIGFDTNLLLRDPYNKMMRNLLTSKRFVIKTEYGVEDHWKGSNANYNKDGSINSYGGIQQHRMIWSSSLSYPFERLNYDFVLTSPPYVNLELYPGMTPFESEKKFYEEFLIPLIDKCRKHCQSGGWVCFNISPKMYVALTEKFKYKSCDQTEELLQQKRLGTDKGDKIYCWRC